MRNREDIPEAHLLELAAKGDKQAFGILYQRYLDDIYRFVFYKVSNQSIAEDITEETFLKIWERMPKIYQKDGGFDNFSAYLYRMANNRVIDYYRKKKPVEIDMTLTESQAPLPEEIMDRQVTSDMLSNAIRKLEPDYQQIIILRFINRLSHKQAASIMNISDVNARVLQFRAIKKLQEMLSEKVKNNV